MFRILTDASGLGLRGRSRVGSGCFGGAEVSGLRTPLGSGRFGGAGLAPCRFGFADRQEMPDHALTGASETTFSVTCAVQHLLVSLG